MTTLREAFNVSKTNTSKTSDDYDIFPDKKLLESLRTQIAENLADLGLLEFTKESIMNEINDSTESLDLSNKERSYLFNLIDNEVNGSGPLTELLNNDNITEIMVNSPKDIYVEIEGKLIKDETVSFINEEHIFRTIQKLTEASGKVIDITNPIIDASLSNGYKITAVIPPLSLNGPVMTIRKDNNSTLSMEDLIRKGTLTPYMARFLAAALYAKLNILICGNSASGKSALLNILSNLIDKDERIIAIQDVAELKLNHKNVVLFQSSDAPSRDLIRNAVKMHPNRIIVEEIKGEEAFDVMQIMNTGYNGTLATLYAANSREQMNRLTTLCAMNDPHMSIPVIQEYIASAIDVVVYIERMQDGKRKITSISEINSQGSNILNLDTIFEFKKDNITNGAITGEFVLYPKATKVFKKIKAYGITDIDDIFSANMPELPNLK